MKKTVYTILIFCLLIGLCLVVMEEGTKNRNTFNVPARFEKITVDLMDRAREEELLFTKKLEAPSTVEIFLQSDSSNEKIVKIISDSEILGKNTKEVLLPVRDYTGNTSASATYIMPAGSYSIYLTSEKTEGQIVVGHQETPKETAEFERLYQIHKGDLNNPPQGYSEIYAADLAGKSCQEEVVYSFTLDKATDIGLSVYLSSAQGLVSVDLIGNNASFFGLAHTEYNRICDQLQTTLSPGEYQFKLSCEDADGQVYIFLNQ